MDQVSQAPPPPPVPDPPTPGLGAEEILSALTATPNVGIAVSDQDGCLVYVNPTYCQLVDRPAEEVLGRPFVDLLAPADRTAAMAFHRAVLAGEASASPIWPLANSQTRDRELQSYSRKLQSKDGRAFRVATVVDVSDQVRARVRLEETRAHLSSLYDAADAGIAVTDGRHRIVTANRAFASLFEQSLNSLPGTALETVAHPELATQWREALDRAAKTDGAERIVLTLGGPETGQDGGRIYALSVRAFRDHENRPAWVNVVTDVTRLRALEDNLREREERLRIIADSVPAAVALIDDEGTCLFVNRTLREWFALDETAVEGRPAAMLDRPGAYPLFADWLGRVSPGASLVFETSSTFPDGQNRHVEVTVAARMVDADPNGHHLFAFDITALKETQEALRSAKELAEAASLAKSDFLAKMSHELRTPLNAVIGFSEMMVQEILGPIGNERYRSYARDILTSGRHLLELINDVLDLSKIEAGRYELAEGEFDLIGVVEEVVNLVRLRARTGGLTLTTRLAPPVPRLIADRRAVKQMLLNLVSNALKFTPSGGAVTISSSRVGDQFVLAVTDTGIGIPEDKLEHLAKPFVQLDSILTRDQEGTGIGLAITKSQIELHGGALRIDSRPGKGTTVSLIFPARRVVLPAGGMSGK